MISWGSSTPRVNRECRRPQRLAPGSFGVMSCSSITTERKRRKQPVEHDNKLPEGNQLTKADTLASALLGELRGLIEAARQRAAQALSAELVLLYWRIGTRLRTEVLGGERAQYGEAIVSTLSRQLSA